MGLNIKKPNYLDTSLIKKDDFNKNYDQLNSNKKHPFILFKDHLEKSWEIKRIDLKNGEEEQQHFDNCEEVNITLDSLKNKSLITYIDAPWGSGKTYFVENLVKWIKRKDSEEEFKFSNSPSKININVLDAWEIYNHNNIEDFLVKSFNIDQNDFNEFLKNIDNKWTKTKSITRKILLTFKKIISALKLSVKVGGLVGVEIEFSKLFENDSEFLESWKTFKEKNEDKIKNIKEKDLLSIMFSEYIEDKYKENNNMIIIDNIERLSSKNRLDVINKIMNWANLSGTTYLFLTNFQKINFSTTFEEDFWNKISLHETFKLTNSWETYISEYTQNEFDLSSDKLEQIRNFILNMIPLFFSNNNDNMDIREMKKLLDNWNEKNDILKEELDDLEKNKKLIISLLKEIIEKNLEGLDKYFFINYSISWLSENNWNLWENDLNGLNIENIEETPLINNKMFRIQSNFYNLDVEILENKIVFSGRDKEFKIKEEEIEFFKKFNNFIDDTASKKFQIIINDILKTREIDNENNYLYRYIKFKETNKIKYFEFKYNNHKKIHIYNEIFKEV